MERQTRSNKTNQPAGNATDQSSASRLASSQSQPKLRIERALADFCGNSGIEFGLGPEIETSKYPALYQGELLSVELSDQRLTVTVGQLKMYDHEPSLHKEYGQDHMIRWYSAKDEQRIVSLQITNGIDFEARPETSQLMISFNNHSSYILFGSQPWRQYAAATPGENLFQILGQKGQIEPPLIPRIPVIVR